MAETTKVVAKKRDRAGKGGARSSRRDGLIPAVIYGDKQAPVMIAVEPKSVEKVIHSIFLKLGLAYESSVHKRVKAVILYLAEAE